MPLFLGRLQPFLTSSWATDFMGTDEQSRDGELHKVEGESAVLLQVDYMIAGMLLYQHAGLGEREVRAVRTVGERSFQVDLPTGLEV